MVLEVGVEPSYVLCFLQVTDSVRVSTRLNTSKCACVVRELYTGSPQMTVGCGTLDTPRKMVCAFGPTTKGNFNAYKPDAIKNEATAPSDSPKRR